jgi:hypothetical protein
VIVPSRIGRRAAASLVLAVLIGGCGSPAPTASPSTAGSTPSVGAIESQTTSASPAPAQSTLVEIDPGLLDLLPDSVAGLALEGSPEAAAESASSAALAQSADSIAVAIAADPASGSFVVTSVVKLQSDVFDDEFFRDWRDSFDEGVCAQAGGVSGNAQAELGGRTVYIGSCAGGVHTYHTHLEDQDVIVSVNAVGEGRLGEELMETLPD